jgi:hypothetical protein
MISVVNIWGKLPGRLLVIAAVVALLSGSAAACSEASSSFGRPYTGRSLSIRVMDSQRLPVLQYSNYYPGGGVGHHRVVPTQEGMELMLIRLQISNPNATNHLINIDQEAAELRDIGQGTYLPVDVASQGESWAKSESGWDWADNLNLPGPLEALPGVDTPNPPQWDPRNVRAIDVGVPEGQGFLAGEFELPKGFSIDGWILFEAPRGTEFRHIRWQAGDTITIPL